MATLLRYLDGATTVLPCLNNQQVRATTKAAVPLDYVLGVGGFDLDKVEAQVLTEEGEEEKEEEGGAVGER